MKTDPFIPTASEVASRTARGLNTGWMGTTKLAKGIWNWTRIVWIYMYLSSCSTVRHKVWDRHMEGWKSKRCQPGGPIRQLGWRAWWKRAKRMLRSFLAFWWSFDCRPLFGLTKTRDKVYEAIRGDEDGDEDFAGAFRSRNFDGDELLSHVVQVYHFPGKKLQFVRKWSLVFPPLFAQS